MTDFLFSFLSDVFSSWRPGAEAAEITLVWIKWVCVCCWEGQRLQQQWELVTEQELLGLWGFSWLSERLKGRLHSRGRDRECRPLPLVFAASWRPLLNQKLCLCLSTARWKYSVRRGAVRFTLGPRCAIKQRQPALGGECSTHLVLMQGGRHFKYYVTLCILLSFISFILATLV